MHIDAARTGRGAFRRDRQIDVTAAAVGIGHRLRVVVQLLRRIDAALLHLEQGANTFASLVIFSPEMVSLPT